jgi:signal transduction histidine kinase
MILSNSKKEIGMKSITMLYNQNQSHPKTNGSEGGLGSTENKKKISRRSKKTEDKKTLGQGFPGKEIDRSSVQERIGMIIHEIRNPLTAISLANQSLREEIQYDNLPLSFNVYTDIVSKNINRIEALLKTLLSLNCQGKIEFVPTDVCDVIEQCLQKADDRIFLKKLDVSISYSQGLLINGNAEQLSIVFLNIIINAIEAVREGEGNLWITVYQLRNEVKVVFKDDGCGMEPDVAVHMFDKNFSAKSKGLGVGMSHVQEILALHHASISVNSEPGTGTTIILSFKRLQ